jgi:hypothetical protein
MLNAYDGRHDVCQWPSVCFVRGLYDKTTNRIVFNTFGKLVRAPRRRLVDISSGCNFHP